MSLSPAAEAIIQQLMGTPGKTELGVGRLVVFLGASNFTSGPTHVAFRFKARAKNGANHCRIEVTPLDVYTVVFTSIRGIKVTAKGTNEHVYSDSLKPVFEHETGLFLSLK